MSTSSHYPSTISKSAFRASALLATLAMIFSGIGQVVVYTIVPPLARDLSLNEFQIGLITSVSAICAVITAPLWGRASDRFGRSTVMATCLILYSLTNALFAFALKAGMEYVLTGTALLLSLIVTRACFGAGSIGTQPAATAMMADVSTAENRNGAMAYIGLGRGLGMILGPLYVIMLAGWGATFPLFILSLIPIPLLFLLLLVSRTQPESPSEEGIKLRLYDRALFPIVVISFASYVGMAMLQQTAAFFVQDRLLIATMEEATTLTGWAIGGFAAAALAVQIVIARLPSRQPIFCIRVAIPIMISGYLILLVAGNLGTILIGMVVTGAGLGLLSPNLLAAASERVSSHLQGAVAGVMSAAAALSFVVGPVSGGLLYKAANWLPLVVLSLIAAGAWLVSMMTNSHQPSTERQT